MNKNTLQHAFMAMMFTEMENGNKVEKKYDDMFNQLLNDEGFKFNEKEYAKKALEVVYQMLTEMDSI